MFLRVRILFGAIPLLYDSNNGDGAWIQYLSGVLLEGGASNYMANETIVN